jgi:hypothetical protein
MKFYAIGRIEKRKAYDRGWMERHNHRAPGTIANSEPKRGDVWRIFGVEDVGGELERREKAIQKTIRKDAVHLLEVMLTATPNFFGTQDGALPDPEITKIWIGVQVDFLKAHFGENLLAIWGHTDEKTPHVHAYVHPLMEGKGGEISLCAKRYNDRRALKKFQDALGIANAHLGLSRGEEGSLARHLPPSAARAKGKREIDAAIESARKLEAKSIVAAAALAGQRTRFENQTATLEAEKIEFGERTTDLDRRVSKLISDDAESTRLLDARKKELDKREFEIFESEISIGVTKRALGEREAKLEEAFRKAEADAEDASRRLARSKELEADAVTALTMLRSQESENEAKERRLNDLLEDAHLNEYLMNSQLSDAEAMATTAEFEVKHAQELQEKAQEDIASAQTLQFQLKAIRTGVDCFAAGTVTPTRNQGGFEFSPDIKPDDKSLIETYAIQVWNFLVKLIEKVMKQFHPSWEFPSPSQTVQIYEREKAKMIDRSSVTR